MAVMSMKTVRQFLNEQDKKLWKAIKDKTNLDFINPDRMETRFKIEYGDRPLFSGLENESVDTIADLIAELYKDRWNDAIAMETPSLGADSKRTVTETVEDNRETSTDNLRTDKVSALNADDLIDDSAQQTDGTETVDGTKTREVSEETTTRQRAIDNLTWEQTLNIINLAARDVANFISLTVYEEAR